MTRILVAEDDRVAAHMLCAVLRRGSYEPDVAVDVPAFLAACARAPAPTAVLLDLHMPGGTGLDAIRGFMEIAAVSSVPLILMSGTLDETLEAAGRRLGAVAFLLKPIDPCLLLETIAAATTS